METEKLLQDILAMHSKAEQTHQHDMQEFRTMYLEHSKNHHEGVAILQQLLAASENRIAETNAMISKLSSTCNSYQATIDRLQNSLELALENEKRLLQENERLLKENEAYYAAVKLERERYDSAMQTVINAYSTKSSPMVKIEQQ